MILGIGIDLCHVGRIRRSVDRLGDAWVENLFSVEERIHCISAPDSALAFACGFVCKEACSKALGTGFAKGVSPRDITLSIKDGVWNVVFEGGARRRLRKITPAHHTPRCQAAATSLGEILSCIVVIEAT